MKFLLAFVSLLACFLNIEAYQFQISVSTMIADRKSIRGDLVAIVTGKNTPLKKIIFDASSFREYKNVMNTFSFEEEIETVSLYFNALDDKNAKFAIGPIVIAKLGTPEVSLFKPINKFISGNKGVSCKKVKFM